MENKVKMLLSPIQIGPLRLRNRMVMSPMLIGAAGANGEVTKQAIDYYECRARGGVAMIIVEVMAVAARYAFPNGQLRIDDAKFMPRLHRLVEAIHLNSVACEFQLHCAGAFGKDPISPSGVPCYGSGRTTYIQPRVLSLSEVEEIRDFFIKAAVRAQELECDGVLLHGSTSYLLEQWVSPHTNKRTDRFGGSFENRITLPLEIIRGIRKKCGSLFVIGYSMMIDELLPDGITLEESLRFAEALEKEGIDHIDLMVGTYGTAGLEGAMGRSTRQPRGIFERAEAFKKIVGNMKIFARCMGEHRPAKWEEALEKGQCDAIQIGRPLLSDPKLPKKVAEGRLDDIRLCIRCGQCYETAVVKHYQVACSVNPELTRERDYLITRAFRPKQVLVIGGGPGGLEAARVAALRGHEVTLMEKEAELGGNARIASLPIGKEDFKTYIDWLERQCRKAGVKVELDREVSAPLVDQLAPDVVIVATGAIPFIPPIPGIDKRHVLSAADVLENGKARVQGRVIVAGGGQVGIETADFIVGNNLSNSVVIIEMLPVLGTDMPATPRVYMLQVVLPREGVRVFTNMHIEEITEKGVLISDKNWKKRTFEADTVVNAMGYVSNGALSESLNGKIPELYSIGDCIKPRDILHAVHEAAYVARHI